MKSLQKSKTLIIPDIHQDIGWAKRILWEEEDRCDNVVFLGDYFDTFKDPDNVKIYSIKNTCLWLNETKERLGDRAVWLIGNHDVSYMSVYKKGDFSPQNNTFYYCSGWTKSKASEINKNLREDFFSDLELCVQVGDYIASHAGFNDLHLSPHLGVLDNIKAIHQKWENEKHSFKHEAFHWIWDVGPCRNGNDRVGSPVWLDWNHEFADIEEIKQIVGHTSSYEGARSCGLNWCLDGMQSCYGVVNEQGELSIKYC